MKKNLFKNYIFSAAYSLINVIIPVILIPYVSRMLHPEGVGAVAYAQNIVSYFILFASLGIPNYGVREIAKVADERNSRSQIFTEILTINAVATIMATSLYYIVVVNLPYFKDYKSLLLVVGISLFLNCFNIDWFYRGMEEFKYITIRGYIVKILAVLAVFIFVKKESDYILYGLILTLATSCNYILNIIHSRKYISFPAQKLQLKKHLKPIVFMFATAVAVEIYAQLDTTMLGFLCGDKYVGYYTNAIRLIRIVAVVITSIGTILLPRLSVVYEKNDTVALSEIVNKAIDYILLISIPATLGLWLVSEEVVLVFFGKSFAPAIVTMKLLSLLVPILSIGNIFGTQLMVATKLEKQLTVTVFLGAIVNVCLNSILITRYQQNGAAVASVAAETAVMIAQICIAGRKVKTSIDVVSLEKLSVQAIAMLVAIICVKKIHFTPLVMLTLEVIIGVFVFVIVGLVVKNNLMLEILKRIKRRKDYK